MTKAEREHLAKLADLGCCVCIRCGFGPSPAEMHHPRDGQGMATRAGHMDAIPLCPNHHRLADGTPNFENQIAFHHSPAEFIRRYGTERELREWCWQEIYG